MTHRHAYLLTIFVAVAAGGCGSDVTFASGTGGGGAGMGGGGSTVATGGAGMGGDGSSASSTGGAGMGGDGSGGVGTTTTGGGTIMCDDQVCDSATQECCQGQLGANCISIGDMCEGAALACTGVSSCMGTDICCLSFNMGSASSACQPAPCGGGGPGGGIQLCDSSAECANNGECTVSPMGPPGLKTCGF